VILNCQLKSQIIELNSINDSIFDKYDVIFIGEQHDISVNDSIEALLTSKIYINGTKVLLELGYDQNYLLNNFFTKKDTTTVNFLSNKISGSVLSGTLYNFKITPKAIDILSKEDFTKELILEAYSKKEKAVEVINDINEFSKIGMMRPPHVIKNMNKYDRFLEKFTKNRALHMKCLGSDSTKVIEYFEALKAAIEKACDPNTSEIGFSDFREEFLFKMIKGEIENDSYNKVISINGLAHIYFDKNAQLKRIKNKNWSPVACKIKNAFPNKKICSIYLLNIAKNKYFHEDYPEELKYILKNTEPNKSYIINLDYNGSPFINLVNKFTYIVVY
jgi:hypothetical protein